VTSIAPISEVALDRDDGARRLDHLLRLHVGERLCDCRPRVRLLGGAAETAAHEQIEPRKAAVVACTGHQPEVVRVDVDAVVTLDGDGGLELARQVALAVERVRRIGLIRCGQLTVQPDLAVTRAWSG